MKISIYNISFNYKLLPTLVFIIFFTLFIKLGFWQLDRADQKKIINMAFVDRQSQPPIPLNNETIQMPIEDIIWHHVTISGEFLNDKNIILDNQVVQEKVGFLIYTPFKILDSNRTILVNRGWYPLSNSRNDVPNIPPIKGAQAIEGEINQMPSSGISLGKVVTEKLDESSFRLQKMDYEVLCSLLGKDLMRYVVKLKKPIFDKTYILDSGIPVPDSDKNYGYAFQWFAMAFTLFIIFIRLGLKKK
ncbi:MAG: SURF1 family protein [Candidatus Methylopumilus sp.]|nr:SURF1 family protein [Candidatus Methylopumilus sp.]